MIHHGRDSKKYHKAKNLLEEKKAQRKKRYTYKVENLSKITLKLQEKGLSLN
jgi:hypothetical protein